MSEVEELIKEYNNLVTDKVEYEANLKDTNDKLAIIVGKLKNYLAREHPYFYQTIDQDVLENIYQ